MLARWSWAVLIGLGITGAVALLAWTLSPEHPGTSAVVFAATALPFGVLVGWVVAVARPPASTTGDSAESAWLGTALSGAATDVVVAAGLALAVVSVAGLDLPAQLVLLGVLLVVLASATTRYALARARAVGA
ncbi:hypothetical protein CLV28_0761 [Sediminihabitans luteus]|uniref:Uncharacterized protein n=1 Tax=Sediminihabitans luteus TaxID=1138585 RepID=A0A2M9D059_9CELL|nr:hypothetical protein [Sediminihabitans luteus]PJJ77540.1 hypothetical protein CLV28_0761 [Sediminihabitans luteus]GII98439.1 hypothetical protein Slu03_08170 [Sediminihabitans luteus]